MSRYPVRVPSPSTAPVVSASAATTAVLRGAVVVTAALGVLLVVVAAIVGGGLAALGAGLGAVIALAFFASGHWAVSRILSGRPEIALSGGLAVYLGQILVLFLLIALLKDATWLDPHWFAGAVVAVTLVWIVMLIWGTQRYKVLVVEPGTGPDQEARR